MTSQFNTANPATEAATQPTNAMTHSRMKLMAVPNTKVISKIHAPTEDVLCVIGVNVTVMSPNPARIHGAKSEPHTMTASTGSAIDIDL